MLGESKTVVIAPGYGMAVAKAQNQVAELTEKLRHLARTCGSPCTPPRAGFPVI